MDAVPGRPQPAPPSSSPSRPREESRSSGDGSVPPTHIRCRFEKKNAASRGRRGRPPVRATLPSPREGQRAASSGGSAPNGRRGKARASRGPPRPPVRPEHARVYLPIASYAPCIFSLCCERRSVREKEEEERREAIGFHREREERPTETGNAFSPREDAERARDQGHEHSNGGCARTDVPTFRWV